jgi:hypothetical protein
MPDRAASRTVPQWHAAKRRVRRGGAVGDSEVPSVGDLHEPGRRVADVLGADLRVVFCSTAASAVAAE